MSLDVYLTSTIPTTVFDANITHNISGIADAAGIYPCIWRPNENGIKIAKDLIEPITKGLELLRSDPERFRKLDSPNGWGTYDNFIPWLEKYLRACIENPEAEVSVSR